MGTWLGSIGQSEQGQHHAGVIRTAARLLDLIETVGVVEARDLIWVDERLDAGTLDGGRK